MKPWLVIRKQVPLLAHRPLMTQMIRREVAARYRGSVLGIFWSLITPLLMLSVYTFIFGTVFRARGWAGVGEAQTTTSFALILFAGLIPFSLFSEVIARAPQLVVSKRNYVKKVVFPLETLAVISMGAALVQAGVSFAVLALFLVVSTGGLPPTALLLPLVLLPFVVLTLGLAWVLAALGVYLRDIGQLLPPLLSAAMFLSAIFYPLSALPSYAQTLLLWLNPLVFPIDEIRKVLIFGMGPNWPGLALYALVSLAVAILGYAFFQKTRKGFADVL